MYRTFRTHCFRLLLLCALLLPNILSAQQVLTDEYTQDAREQQVARLQDADPGVRAQAALALWKVNDPRALPYLLEALKLPGADIHHQVLRALTNSRDHRVLEAMVGLPMDKQDAEAMGEITQVLAQFNDPRAVTYALEALNLPEAGIHHQVLRALIYFHDPQVLETLLALPLGKQDAEAMDAIIQALANYNDPRALAYLLEALKFPGAGIRQQVLLALGNFHDPKVLEIILALPMDEQDTNTMTATIQTLAHFDDPRVLAYLCKAFELPDTRIRHQVLTALGNFHDPKVLDILLALPTDKRDTGVMAAIIQALAHFDDPRALSYLLKALEFPDAGIHQQVLMILSNYRDPKVLEALLALPAEKQDAAARNAITQALAHFDDPRAQAYLLAMQKLPDADEYHRRLWALRRSHDPRTLDYLLALPKDKQDAEAMYAIVQTLANFNDPRALAYLLETLKLPDADVYHQVLKIIRPLSRPQSPRGPAGAANRQAR